MKFLKFDIINTETLKITDTGMSRDGEKFSLNYIPGASLKGAVINALAAELEDRTDVFERAKKELLSSETVFCNSYITDGTHEMFPSPMGFYEDKIQKEGEKELNNTDFEKERKYEKIHQKKHDCCNASVISYDSCTGSWHCRKQSY